MCGGSVLYTQSTTLPSCVMYVHNYVFVVQEAINSIELYTHLAYYVIPVVVLAVAQTPGTTCGVTE